MNEDFTVELHVGLLGEGTGCSRPTKAINIGDGLFQLGVVRATGTVVEKQDPMELKMPVRTKNQMVVRLEGGYKQITRRTLAKIAAATP
jgi:hypothetical protein